MSFACNLSCPQDMFGYSRKTVTNLIEGLDGALDVKDYVFYAHRHNVGRRSLTGEKKPKKPRNKANTKSEWIEVVRCQQLCSRGNMQAICFKIRVLILHLW